MKTFYALSALILMLLPVFAGTAKPAQPTKPGNVYAIQEGYVDANGVMIYYKIFGHGKPLVLAHGGPGASHDYFLPYLAPLARHYQLVFIDERGSGRSPALENVSAYTVENMVNVESDARKDRGFETGHPARIRPHDLCGLPADLRDRINRMESDALYGHGKDYEKNRYTSEYMTAAWGDGYFPYLYRNHPDPNYDPIDNGKMSWDLYREMWGSHGEFVIDGNLKSVEYTDRLPAIKVPTLLLVGDHDECDPAMSKVMHEKIAGSKLVILPESGHMTFVDQPGMFGQAVEDFLGK